MIYSSISTKKPIHLRVKSLLN